LKFAIKNQKETKIVSKLSTYGVNCKVQVKISKYQQSTAIETLTVQSIDGG